LPEGVGLRTAENIVIQVLDVDIGEMCLTQSIELLRVIAIVVVLIVEHTAEVFVLHIAIALLFLTTLLISF